jgi:hypothetical protein
MWQPPGLTTNYTASLHVLHGVKGLLELILNPGNVKFGLRDSHSVEGWDI